MNSFSVKAEFQIGQFKSLKQIFSKFLDQFDLEGQGQGQKFEKTPRALDDQYTAQYKFQVSRYSLVQSCCINKESYKIFKFQGQFHLEGQGQGHQF